MRLRLFQVAMLGAVSLSACGGHGSGVARGHIDFNDDIRPVLSENCFKCHGPDTATRKAGLRLDLPGPAYGEIPEDKGKRAVVPGEPEQSELIRRITANNPDDRMPKGKPPLKPEQITLLTEWIKQGAPYKPLWSLIVPTRPDIPKSRFDAQAVNDVDRLVFAKLEKEAMRPSKEADRATLINRVSLTLTGLPPTLEEVDAFVADKSPNAYEKVVDRLLASPAYGERMASMWMDLARWADTDGSLDDEHDRYLWPWRDWVIQSFQQDLPFDKFITWQVSGDLLPNPTREQILATAFLRLGERVTENGALNEQFRVESVVDKTNTVGTAFLGVTVGCARCHDHKFDVISQKDYYSMSGFFNSLDEPGVYPPGYTGLQAGPTLQWPTPEQQAQLTQTEIKLTQALQNYQRALDAATHAVAPRVTAMLGAGGPRPQLRPTSLPGGGAPSLNAEPAQILRSSVAQAQVAYYPFDAVEPIPKSAYPTLRRPPLAQPPAGLQIVLKKPAVPYEFNVPELRARKPPPPPVAPRTYNIERMRFSPSGMQNVPPAVIQEPKLGPGAKGQALYFTATNKGYLGRDVGYYNRTQQFSFDFWFYPADTYKTSVPVFSHCNVQNSDAPDSGVSGYQMEYDQQKLVFYMAHVRPWNMLAVALKKPLPLKQWSHIALTYDGSSKASGIQVYVNGDPTELDVVRDNLTESILPLGNPGQLLEEFVGLSFGTRFRQPAPVGSALDEFRVFNRALTAAEVAYLDRGERALQRDGLKLRQSLTTLLVERDPQVIEARRRLDEARSLEDQARSSIPEVLVAGDTPTPRPTYLLHRGVYDQREQQVPVQGLTQIFTWRDSLPANRLGLAQWLTDRRNPLTARVFVNRLWQIHFGSGLVKTAEDFGSQGSLPSNQPLLDWLAVEFMDSGWDIRHIQKIIVMSATYRQSSDVSEDARTKDPTNAMLARGPRFRMTAEMIRDSALADAGLLVAKVGGPSVYPYQPEVIWDPQITRYTYPKPDEVPPEQHHRRSLYTFVKRNALHPGLQLLDAADPTVSTARLNASNTPLQALLLFNDVQYQEAYRMMATRALKASGDATAQLTMVFRLARRLYPDAEQLSLLHAFYNDQLGRYQSDRASATQLVSVGVTPIDRDLDVAQLAALTSVCAVVMNAPDSYFVR